MKSYETSFAKFNFWIKIHNTEHINLKNYITTNTCEQINTQPRKKKQAVKRGQATAKTTTCGGSYSVMNAFKLLRRATLRINSLIEAKTPVLMSNTTG